MLSYAKEGEKERDSMEGFYWDQAGVARSRRKMRGKKTTSEISNHVELGDNARKATQFLCDKIGASENYIIIARITLNKKKLMLESDFVFCIPETETSFGT